VTIYLANGQEEPMYVKRQTGDLAWLEISTGFDRLQVPAPPVHHAMPAVGDVVCAGLPMRGSAGLRCGELLTFNSTSSEFSFDAPGFVGESGAGVWLGEETLLGVMHGLDEHGNTVVWRLR
jgi:hypothetical protein